MRVIRINTTAYMEEDFFLMTTLSDDQISEVIRPIVQAERDEEGNYNNNILVHELVERFPLEYIAMFTEFDEIKF